MSTSRSIPTANDKQSLYYPLHLAQQEVYYDQITDPTNPSYNVGGYVRLKGQLNKAALFEAAQSYSTVFDVFNFEFEFDTDQPGLKLKPKAVAITIKEIDFSTESNPEQAASDWMQERFNQAFAVEQNQFFEHALLKISANEHYWFLRYHHLMVDGYGISTLLQYLASKYQAIVENATLDTTNIPAYTAEIQDSINYLETEAYQKDRAYWMEQFARLPEPLLEQNYNDLNGNDNEEIILKISKEQNQKFDELAKATGSSLQQLSLAALTLYFGRSQDRKEVVFGIPIHNRRNKRQRNIAGMFSRFIPFKGSYQPDQKVLDFIASIKRQQRMDYRYQAFPISHLNRELKLLAQGRNQLFEVVVNYATLDLDLPFVDLENESCHLRSNQGDDTPLVFWWCAYGNSQELELKVNFKNTYFSKSEAQLLTERMLFILEQFHADVEQEAQQIQIILDKEKEIILGRQPNADGIWFNEKEVDLGNNLPINVRFEEVVAANKDAIAVVHGHEKWRYDKLNKFSNQLAHSLMAIGVKAGDLVGVHLERNPYLVSSLMGILKCGAVYVPLDIQNPKERIEKMIENGKLQAVITNESLFSALGQMEVESLLLLDSCSAEFKAQFKRDKKQIRDIDDINKASSANPDNVNELQSWAYMLYTSGSTGQPKGAITRHDGALNHILAEYELLELEDGFRFLQSASIGSDISLFQILAPILKGGATVIIDRYELLDYNFALNKIDSEEITILEAVPSYLRGLANWVQESSVRPSLKHLKWIMMVGEEVPVKLVNIWKTLYPKIRILNGYGPCEASDDITQYEVKAVLNQGQKRVPIGRPLTNMNIFITQKDGSLCPIGVAGELCVTGVGVGAGYWRMPEKTAASFIDNPFEGTLGDTLYKTGDRARWMPDGNLEFLGRIDRQLKIRGNRVELGEIESLMREEPLVREAHVVVHKQGEKNESLIAFAVLEDKADDTDANTLDTLNIAEKATPASMALSKADRKQILEDFNDTAVNYDKKATILDIFKQRVEEYPENVAIVFGDQEVTYRELDERSNKLGNYLRNKGLREESFVAICVDRSPEMVVCALAVMKAGGVYVPIDPEYPQDRIDYLIDDANAKYVISQDKYLSFFSENKAVQRIALERESDSIAAQASTLVPNKLSANHLVYIYYTSGSTGKPKGVMIEHGSLYNMAICWLEEYQLEANTSLLQIAGFSFDVFAGDLCRSLLSGGKMVICDQETLLDFEQLYSMMIRHQINILEVTPTLGISLLDYAYENELDMSWMKLLIVGSDKCSAEGFRRMIMRYGEQFRIINSYGTTETTIDSSYYENTDLDSLAALSNIPIGKPLYNTKYYVLDEDLEPVPVGVEGEIYIGGDGLARGYLNKPGLTRERFIENPFCPGERMYRTGDTGMWLSDGNLQCMGRIDDQVKVGGNRIELGEIETTLQKHSSINQCIVLAKEYANGNKKLVAYVVPQEGYKQTEVLAYLNGQLPAYMVPFMLLELEEFPLTPNGKIDKKALLNLDASEKIRKRLKIRCQEGLPTFMQPTHYCIIGEMPLNLSDKVDEKALLQLFYEQAEDVAADLDKGEDWIAPETETEQKLAAIWKGLLEVKHVGRNDNFFQLGGHSLFATRLVAAIKKQLGVVISIKDIFTYPTVSGLSEYIAQQDIVATKPSNIQVDRPAMLPLSFAQERLWFIDKLQGSVHYHMPAVLDINGAIDIEILEKALQTIVNRHAVLRTVFKESGVCYQEIMPENSWTLIQTNQSEIEADTIQDYIDERIQQPFDLSRDHMLRAELISLGSDQFKLILLMHHIASDGWSVSIFIKELETLYQELSTGKVSSLQPLNYQYADYAIWQRTPAEQERLEKRLSYWEDKLKGVEPVALPLDFARPAVQSVKGSRKHFLVEQSLNDKLKQLAQEEGVTQYMLLLAAFKVLLYKYSGQTDICVGTPIANRTLPEVEPLIGFFVNTLALRSDLDGNPGFRNLLNAVKTTTLEAYTNQEVPFERIVDRIENDRDRSRTPIYQVVFALQNAPSESFRKLGEAQVELEPRNFDISKFDLTFNLSETKEGLDIEVEYCTDLFLPETIDLLAAHYEELLKSILANPQARLDDLSAVGLEELVRVQSLFNNTKAAYPRAKHLVQLFEEQVNRTPEKVAVHFKGDTLTYAELNARANQLAHLLKENGVEKGERVGLLTYRGFDMLISILGVLKVGAVYVPVNTDFPPDRIKYILEDAGVKFVLYNDEQLNLSHQLDEYKFLDICVLDEYSTLAVEVDLKPVDPVYVMYTSGTTGEPKGIVVSHQNVVKLAFEQKEIAILPEDRVLQWSNYAFDGSTYDIYSTLLNGASLFLIEEAMAPDAVSLTAFIEENEISLTFITTALFNAIVELNVDVLAGMRRVLFGGEKVSTTHVEKAIDRAGADKIIHVYGPTETTVYASYFPIRECKQATVPIGMPLSNTRIYIVNQAGNLAGIGMQGEVWIEGDGVSHGYLNKPEITAEKFIPNPFDNDPSSVVYKTGDLARWLPSGAVEFIGRADSQVKIRGYRIELGEIERLIQQSEYVSHNVVLTQKDNTGVKQLIAYVVPRDGYDKETLLEALRVTLPAYMIPAIVVELDTLPLNANGKIDKKALPKPDLSQLSRQAFVAPRDETEIKLAALWKALLNLEKVGVYDNFFELGGHSLLATRLASSIREEFAINIPLGNLFQYTCIADLAKYIDAVSAVDEESELEFEVMDF